ncbi:MAG: ECF-type sigma factor [Acidobacteriota bacterium]
MTAERSSSGSVTRLLRRWREGREEARDELVARVYPQLQKIARLHMRRERLDHSMQPTALVHEVYVRLIGEMNVDWRDRQHFFSIASAVMRRVLVDHARARQAKRRQGIHVVLKESDAMTPCMDVDVLDLEDALRHLETSYPFEGQVIQLRYFGGLSIEEAAEQLGVGHATVQRAWTFARAWLLRELKGAAAT